jgi:hypothetical protein
MGGTPQKLIVRDKQRQGTASPLSETLYCIRRKCQGTTSVVPKTSADEMAFRPCGEDVIASKQALEG